MEASKGIYKPIRVLFNTPIYNTAMEICWYLPGYRAQIAIMVEFLRLQRANQIPSNITAEDMRDLLVERSKETVREQLWEFELEAMEETEAKPLLKLVWAVNIINKMREIEFQAQMLLKFPKAIPPKFQSPQLRSRVREYIEVLKEKQQEGQGFKLLTAPDVVIEVVPRVLHGFWKLPPLPLLNMASKRLSTLSTSVTKATLDRVSKSLREVEKQAIFSHSIRDGMVHKILSEVRGKYPIEVLLEKMENLSPELLRTITDVAKNSICKIFESPCESPAVSDVCPTKEPPFESSSKADVLPTEEPADETLPLSDCCLTEEPPSKSSSMAEVSPTEEPPSKSSLMVDVSPTEEPAHETLPKSDFSPSEEPPSKSSSMANVFPIEEPASNSLEKSDDLPSEDLCSVTVCLSEPVVSDNSQIKKKKKKSKGFYKIFRALCCCCFRPQETD